MTSPRPSAETSSASVALGTDYTLVLFPFYPLGGMGALPPIENFFEMKKELPAVQKAYDLCKEVLSRISKFPKDLKY